MNNSVSEVKDRLKIEDLVSQYVQLKKAGRNFKGLCPFHNEKTPSFVVSPERQIAYCFGCNKGGDVFQFIQEVEGVDFVDALKILAEKTGVELEPMQNVGKSKRVTKDEKSELFRVYDSATSFYEEQLWQTDEGKKVVDYLYRRGLTNESIKRFRVGYAPDSFELTYTHLLKSGFDKKVLVSAGLAMAKGTTVDKIYDRFRGRLIFPILDNLGRIVAFGGRALSKDQQPKYLNSAESNIYHKSNVLYGFYKAKKSIKEKKQVMLVEGYFDVIASVQAGVENVVATSGTALSTKQLRLLKPFAQSIILCFDNDLAGQEAAKRAYELAMEYEFVVKMIVIPDGKDPADYVRDHGDKLVDVMNEAKLYGEYYYDRLFDIYGTDDVSAKKKILQESLPFVTSIKSSIEKDEFVRKLALDLDLKEVQIYDELKHLKLPEYHPARYHSSIENKENVNIKIKRSYGWIILGLMLEFPRIGSLFIDKVDYLDFDEELKPIYKAFVDQYNDDSFESVNDFIERIPQELKENAALVSLYVSETYGEISEVDVEKEINVLVDSVQKERRNAKRRELQRSLVEAEQSKDKVLSGELLKELNSLNAEVIEKKN